MTRYDSSHEPDLNIEYDAATDTYRARIDTAGEEAPRPSLAVIRTVAEAADCGPNELEPLGEWIDPGALDAIVGPRRAGDSRANASVRFAFLDFDVTVDRRTVTVRPRPDGADA